MATWRLDGKTALVTGGSKGIGFASDEGARRGMDQGWNSGQRDFSVFHQNGSDRASFREPANGGDDRRPHSARSLRRGFRNGFCGGVSFHACASYVTGQVIAVNGAMSAKGL